MKLSRESHYQSNSSSNLSRCNMSLTLHFFDYTVQPLPKVKWLLRGSKNRFDRLTW